VNANGIILISALLLDLVVLVAFLWIKASTDIFVVIVSAIGIILVFAGEKWFLYRQTKQKA
jgi:heme/copper-type cytochrome/quinol oxidase subunit 4